MCLLKLRSWRSVSPLGLMILLKTRSTTREAHLQIILIIKKTNSIHRSGSADRECVRPHSSALKARGGKPHGRFPLVAPLFPSKPAKNKAQLNATQKTHATTKDATQTQKRGTQSAATNVRGYIDKRFENSFFRLDARLVLH